jgi:phosphatidylserine/phosphatidylglycerophosphate/cardiolipin synthase-like enzyme
MNYRGGRMDAVNVSATAGDLKVVVYPGDNKVLIAMTLNDSAVNTSNKNLAGFTIWRKSQGKPEQLLSNRITFQASATTGTAAQTWTGSDQAPFQKFRWLDVPPDGFDAPITYRVCAVYFVAQTKALTQGPQVTVTVAPVRQKHTNFKVAFTRGYIASQAYTDKFKNADIRPTGAKTPNFNTKPYQAQYQWLGGDARIALFDFIADCVADKTCLVNVFAYDLDEPDVVSAICSFGTEKRLRAILDNASLHTKSGAPEIAAAKMIIQAAGTANVRQGHFDRFQHNKVFIKRDANGQAQRVIFGSMNYSVRGIYVQANNVAVVDDPTVAGMFAKAFDVAFADGVKAPLFRQNPISQGYMTGSAADTAALPMFSLALSPHTDWSVSLGPMAARIRAASSSVLYAVMEPTGAGPVLATLQEIAAKPTVFSYGTVETDTGLAVQTPNGAMGEVTGFAALSKNVPWPFTKETNGGPGMHIHDKFVVVDFNAANPTVFMGSSNLAAGGEVANGDNLAMIQDQGIANMYAIEAVALFDHFHFRKVAAAATSNAPLSLWYPGKAGAPNPWWRASYDPTQIQMRDRCLFADLPLPPGMATTKAVDWKSLDQASGKTAAKTKSPTAKTTAAKRPAGKK